ncbi:hypothetical protein BDY21DRAFT_367439 [Lineolata rhizophorae]|uniref:Short chain dehydrogenase/reductase n=1 Tax=Lineolata rhizophorae TaxID=578093 RepID=A0A6A6NN42_9PEZI|nr:hypothetical protein BDY21DRAFT_367439 [Lineolata rhizophorae]
MAAVLTKGTTAFITGAGSGIGLAVAKKCASVGMNVALADKNFEQVQKAKENLSGKGGTVDAFEMDVSNWSDWDSTRTKLLQQFGGVDFLMLNAGTSEQGTWGDAEYFRKIMETNLFGVINGLNALLPTMHESHKDISGKPAAIVITGSKQGITNPPGNAAYNASKSAVKTLAEHLSFDLRHTGIGVHLLVPGWTYTGLTGGPPGGHGEKPSGAWWPEQVADYMVQKMGDGKFYIICPDNDVSQELDKKRMLWTARDLVNGRPPLTRWREDWKNEAAKGVEEMNV